MTLLCDKQNEDKTQTKRRIVNIAKDYSTDYSHKLTCRLMLDYKSSFVFW